LGLRKYWRACRGGQHHGRSAELHKSKFHVVVYDPAGQ
jgi:hypothetical protein